MTNIRKKILIVEDEKPLLNALESKCVGKDMEVFKATDGEMAFELAKSKNPNIILLDLKLPKIDGISLLKKIRATDWGKNIKTIILTNYEDQRSLMSAVDLGSYDYLIKTDWTIEALMEKIEKS